MWRGGAGGVLRRSCGLLPRAFGRGRRYPWWRSVTACAAISCSSGGSWHGKACWGRSRRIALSCRCVWRRTAEPCGYRHRRRRRDRRRGCVRRSVPRWPRSNWRTAAGCACPPTSRRRCCIGILRHAKTFGSERLEAACGRALEIGARSYTSVTSILKTNLDRKRPAPATDEPAIAHDNIRGPCYFH